MPYAEKLPATHTEAESQSTILIQPRKTYKPSVVTPEYPQKEVIYTKQARATHPPPNSFGIRQTTLDFSTKALAFSQGVLNTRVATLAPRPGKLSIEVLLVLSPDVEEY